MDKKERFEWRKGTRVLSAWIEGDNIHIEEYFDKIIFYSIPIPIKLIKEVMEKI